MEIISNNKTAVNTAEIEFKSSSDEFEAALQSAFLKKRKNITVPGFRKGKASRKMIETHYGEGIFYDEAVNILYKEGIDDLIKNSGLNVIDMPNIEVKSLSLEDGVVFKAVFTTKPEVNISDYKGLKVTKIVKNISDEDVEADINRRREKNARIIDVVDSPAKDGDTVVIDFEGFCDGVPFEGGKADGFELVLGSGQFIPGFEAQVEGHSIGEEFDINVTFPEDYAAESLKGKAVVFKCLIHQIKGKELPELDDEFAKDISEFDTLSELRADVRENLKKSAENDADNQVEADLNNALIDKLEAEIPDVMYESRISELVRDWEYRNKFQGITVKDFLNYSGQTLEQFREHFKEPAQKQVKLRLALEKIAELENIQISEEELEKRFSDLAEEHNMQVEKVKAVISAENLSEDIKVEKAFEIVKNSAEIAS